MGRYELICFIEIFYAVGVKYRYVIFRLRIADNIVVGILCLMQVDIKRFSYNYISFNCFIFIITVSYSVQFFYYLFFNRRQLYRYIYVKEDRLINVSIVIIIFLRVIVGSICDL
ncbi:hypothetical protein ALC56_14321 [Trachymyrmex septentrionalis]|uniref:Uncharacterized protein n=1 Tax=Trachymyrmex septentrionalis TaxID=34720 RepID=A0A195ET62_9HYME|nr:hypothetical protein ALC56_14321 [Trachymyrmex septentrionalis]